MKWKNRGREFDALAEIICDEKNVYVIWGAGTFGRSFYDTFRERVKVICFVDSDEQKMGGVIDGKAIFSPQNLNDLRKRNPKMKVIVANGWLTEVYAELNKMGYVANQDYFHANDFTSIYMFYKENKIYQISANCDVTTKCSLACEKCMALVPYVKQPRNFSLDEIKEDLNAYFRWIDYLEVLGIGGGDVLMHPQFAEILEYVCVTYRGIKVQDIEIYTNAVIMPSEQILKLCKEYDVIVRFSDYSKEIQGRQKIQELVGLLQERGIRYDCCVWDTWYDIGFPQVSNGIEGELELCGHYDKCITKLCTIIYQKRLYFCSVHASAIQAGYCESLDADCFNLSDYCEEKRKEFIEFNAGYCEKGYLTWCKRCNGYQNINNKFIPVARQIKRDIFEN